MSHKHINSKHNNKEKYLEILKNDPNNYDVVLKLGLIDIKENNFNSAKANFKQLIKIDKSKFEGYLNLANIYSFEGKALRANDILRNFLNNIEENLEIINAIAINLLNTENFIDLENHLNKYVYKKESHILYYLKGFMLAKEGKLSKSESCFKKSISINASFWNNYDYLFQQYEKQSRLIDFKKLLVDAKSIFKNNIKVLYFEALYFYRTKNFNNCLNILKNKEFKNKFLSQKNENELVEYYDLCCKVHEKLGFFSDSYNFAIKRNSIILNLNENKKYNKKLILETINTYKNFFNKNNKLKYLKQPHGIKHSNLTFLIGFPRSGTTLLDSILRSHSKTLVLEEKPYLLNIRHEFYKTHKLIDILSIDESERRKMQEKYFSSFSYKSNKLIIDKYPLNLIELGFIKTIFPDSKIILAIRHPLDCIISCVMTAFKINDGMVNFENIHTTSNFYNECFQLLFKYFHFYKVEYHTVKYENVINNFEKEIKKLLEYLNLNYEENINDFQNTAIKKEKKLTPQVMTKLLNHFIQHQ